MRVLVTGAAGSIGQAVVPGLGDRGHEVVAVDLLPGPDGADGPWHVVDCADPDALDAVLSADPVDAVVHLAGNPQEDSLPRSLHSHVVTTGALLDVCVAHGVNRFVLASSNHAVGRTPRHADGEPLEVTALPRPDTFYGVAKVASEALLQLYVDRHGLDGVACRIGSFLPRPVSVRHLSTWLSFDDGVRMVAAALTAPAPGFAVLHGISANRRAWWDLEAGRALGYEPLDDAEEYASMVERGPDDVAEGAVVGGPYALPAAERPALDRM